MATNHYLNLYKNRTEQNLIESLTIESIKFYGMDLQYLPRDTLERDGIFGEDIRTNFNSNYLIEMYLESVDGWGGDGNLLANFGMQIKDTAELIVSKKRFQDTVYGQQRPTEGDLIYIPMSNSLLEINFVEHENPFYQLGKLYTYKLTVENYTYDHSDFDTGQDTIDKINTDYSFSNIMNERDNSDIEQEANIVVIEETNPKDDFENIVEPDPYNEF